MIERGSTQGDLRCVGRRWRLHACVAAALFVLPPCFSVAAETPEVLVELDRQQVFVGEPVNYRVLLNHCGMQAEPNLAGFDAFDVKLVGRTQIRQSQTFSNGRESQQLMRIGPLYEYELTPRTAGRLQVPGPTTTIDGKTYTGADLTLTVADISDQDLVYLSVTTEPESAYPMQPVRIRLTLAVKGLPDPASDTDPLQLRRTLPSLTIPWADDEQLDDALEPKEPLNRWIQPYIDESSYGVAINDYQQAGMSFGGLGGFFGTRQRDPRLAFHPTPRRVLREDGRGRKVEYWEYVFERTVIPQRAGNIPLGSVSLKGQFAARINTRGNVELDSVYTVSRPPDLVVTPPPQEGRPAAYSGVIGSFVGGAELAPVEASVGDPLTLTVWLRGIGALQETTAPDLTANDIIAEQFKVYDATEKTDNDTRRFTYSLRPKTAAAKQFPAIPILTYFDVKQEKYVTLESDPIPISISAARQLASSDIAMASRPADGASEIGTSATGIFANITDLSQLRRDRVKPSRWFLNLSGLACLFVVIALVANRLERVRGDTSLQRRKGAIGRARRRMEAAAGGTARQVADGISGALVGLAADVCGLSEEGLTSADAASGLASRDVPPELVSRVRKVLETCDAMRYASVNAESAALVTDAQRLLTDLAQELRSRKLIT